jgi:hypothetical protein
MSAAPSSSQDLRQQVGMNADSIWKADKEVLMPLAKLGGVRPETSGARQLWPGQNPVGRSLRLDAAGTGAWQVVGVARDRRGVETLDGSDSRQAYLPLPKEWLADNPILIRTQSDPARVTRAIDATGRLSTLPRVLSFHKVYTGSAEKGYRQLMIGRLRLDRKDLIREGGPGGVVSTHGGPSSLKSAVRAESRAAWKQLQPHETGVVDRIRRYR